LFTTTITTTATTTDQQHAIAQEEAFMAAGAFADQIEGEFNKYMVAFQPILLRGLSNHDDYQVSYYCYLIETCSHI
jgi:importin subunit beta-1